MKWNYGALDSEQEHDYVRAKLKMLQTECSVGIDSTEEDILVDSIVESQNQIRQYVKETLLNIGLSLNEARIRASSCVSQRDIQRVFIFYKWLLESYSSVRKESVPHRRAMFVSMALVYYMRLPFDLRRRYVQFVDSSERNFEGELTFCEAFTSELNWYINNVELPPGIAKTEALKENLLATILCCITKVPLIIEGAPGTSKTLSFNIAVANLKGSGSKRELFQESSLYPSLEPQFYQCSRRTTSNEVSTVFNRAINIQVQRNHDKVPHRSVVFMDEAGLPEQAHESLKVLHYLLEHPIVSFVAITNHPLDAAKTNRAVSVYRQETVSASGGDLTVLARDCLEVDQESTAVKRLCASYSKLMMDKRVSDFYGLRDFIYFLIYLRRTTNRTDRSNSEFLNVASKQITYSLERNFGGVEPSLFLDVRANFQLVSSCTYSTS